MLPACVREEVSVAVVEVVAEGEDLLVEDTGVVAKERSLNDSRSLELATTAGGRVTRSTSAPGLSTENVNFLLGSTTR